MRGKRGTSGVWMDDWLMYADAWDHKGPVLLGMAALGQLLPVPGGMGATAVFAVAACLAIWLFWRIAGSYLVTLGFAALLIGNQAGLGLVSQEVLAMPFVLLGITTVLSGNVRSIWRGVVFGACVAAILFVKANLVGFAFAGFAVCCERVGVGWRDVFGWMASAISGFVFFVIVVCGVFAWHGLLYEMVDATFLFGMFEYCKREQSLWSWWFTTLTNWKCASGGWVLVHFAVMLVVAMAVGRKCPRWLWIWLVADFVMTFSFKTYQNHYLIVLYPELCLMVAMGTEGLEKKVGKLFVVGTVLLFSFYSVYGILLMSKRQPEINASADRIRGSVVVAWGDLLTSEVLWRSGVECPQRYFNAHMDYVLGDDRRKATIRDELATALYRGDATLLIMEKNVLDSFLNVPEFGLAIRGSACERFGEMLVFPLKCR